MLDFSPALEPSEVAFYGEPVYATLDEVVRQEAESGILFNATLVRCMLERGICDIPRFRTDFPDFEALEGGDFLESYRTATTATAATRRSW